MTINSKDKGKRGEREFASLLKKYGFDARRGQQYQGSPDSPDVVCDALPFHFEVKRIKQNLHLDKAIEQAKKDCGNNEPIVAYRKDHQKWFINIDAEYFLKNMCNHFKGEK